MMYDYHKNDLGMDDKDIPEAYKVVEAEVLKMTTSLAVRRRYAGEHQSVQREVHHGAAHELLAAFMRKAQEKKALLGTAALLDDEVYKTVYEIGRHNENMLSHFKVKPADMSMESFMAQQVCSFFALRGMPRYFFFTEEAD